LRFLAADSGLKPSLDWMRAARALLSRMSSKVSSCGERREQQAGTRFNTTNHELIQTTNEHEYAEWKSGTKKLKIL
jgi:hypothetical protein